MPTVILLKSEDVTKNSILNGNIDQTRYTHDIKTAQNTYIKPLLGDDLYDKICGDFASQSLSGDYATMYEDYIKEMVVHSSTSLYLQHGAYMVSNVGITRHSTDSSESVNKQEVDFLAQSSRKLYEMYKENFLVWINTKDIQEWVNTCSSTSDNSVGGWYL